MGLPRLAHAAHSPQGDGRGLALHHSRSERVVVKEVLRRAMGRLAYHDAVGRGELLEPGGGVHHVARDHALARDRTGAEVDDRLTRRHAGAGREPGRSPFPLYTPDRVDDRGRGAHRALGVVLVREGRSEDRHHGVARELLQRAAEALHFAPGAREVLPLKRTDVLGVGQLRACSEADEVDEDDADELPFLAVRRIHEPGRTVTRNPPQDYGGAVELTCRSKLF